jgi:hypothetical protein
MLGLWFWNWNGVLLFLLSGFFCLSRYCWFLNWCRLFNSWRILICELERKKNSWLFWIIFSEVSIVFIVLNEVKESNPYLCLSIELRSLNEYISWEAYATKWGCSNFYSSSTRLIRPCFSSWLAESQLDRCLWLI